MIFYIKLGKVRAVSVEFNREFAATPLFKKTSFRCETILDMPYTQLVFTSGKWSPLKQVMRCVANDDNETVKTRKTAKYPSGTRKN